MVLVAAVLLIIVVLAAAVFAVGTDVVGRPAGQRLHALKDWQSLIGAVLGFMGAAGVLVLGTAIQDDQTRAAQVEREHAIGYGLALETERLANGLLSAVSIVNIIASSPNQDYALTCNNFIATLNDILPRETPVWTAALGNMIAFGDNNLAVFVRFYGLYDELVVDAQRFNRVLCDADGKNQIEQIGQNLTRAVEFYRIISDRYGTAIIEPTPAKSST